MKESPRLYAVLVTYDRPEALRVTMGRIAAQTRPPDLLVVVDNGERAPAAEVIADYDGALEISYVATGDNLGPAGGFALGMEQVLETATDDDWIVLLDDDDPPFYDNALERAVEFGSNQVERDSKTGAVGISGGRFDVRRGRVMRIGDGEIEGPVGVGHITGGGLPTYRVGAVREVGTMRSDLFFGFEELEYGLRLTRRGFRLYADGEAWRERKADKRAKGLLPPEEVSARRAAKLSIKVGQTSWRRYYSLRNLILILREAGHPLAAVRVSFVRGLLKPALNLFVSPRSAAVQLRLGARAVWDAWTGRTGRTVEPGEFAVD